jgi:hypothetical protein
MLSQRLGFKPEREFLFPEHLFNPVQQRSNLARRGESLTHCKSTEARHQYVLPLPRELNHKSIPLTPRFCAWSIAER